MHPRCCAVDRATDRRCARAPHNRAILWLAHFRRSRSPRRPGCWSASGISPGWAQAACIRGRCRSGYLQQVAAASGTPSSASHAERRRSGGHAVGAKSLGPSGAQALRYAFALAALRSNPWAAISPGGSPCRWRRCGWLRFRGRFGRMKVRHGGNASAVRCAPKSRSHNSRTCWWLLDGWWAEMRSLEDAAVLQSYS